MAGQGGSGGTVFRQTPLTCPGHTRPVVRIHYSGINDDGKFFFISASKDGQPMLHQGDTGDWIGTFTGHKGAVWGACLNVDGTKAATGAADFSAKVWNAVSGEELLTLTHKHIVKTVDFSHDGTQLITGCNDKNIRLYSLTSPKPEPIIFQGHKDSVKCAVWTLDPNIFASSDESSKLSFWDVRSVECVKELPLPGPVYDIELNRSLAQLTVAHCNGVTFVDPLKMDVKLSHILSTEGKLFSASIHPNSEEECFVAGGEDFKLYKISLQDGKEIESYKGHFGPVHCVRYSPDGEIYCSGSEDGTIRLWQHSVGKTYGLWKNSN